MKRTIGGIQLGFDDRGEGPALVLLHAFPLDRRQWSGDAAALAATGRRVITIDARGFGESALGGGYAVADLAEDVVGLLDALGISMAAVLGLSMGGYVALALAQRHPARLAALILSDTRAAADSQAALQARRDGIRAISSGGLVEFLSGIPDRLLSPAASELLKAQVRELTQARPEALIAALTAMRDRPERGAELGALRCPTLVLVGAQDSLTPPSEARAMAEAIPGASFVELPGAGHLANLEAPQAFRAEVIRFLDQV